jgi:hypothetical protein
VLCHVFEELGSVRVLRVEIEVGVVVRHSPDSLSPVPEHTPRRMLIDEVQHPPFALTKERGVTHAIVP